MKEKLLLALVFLFISNLVISDNIHVQRKSIIPAYVSDNHGLSFYFFANNLSWDIKYTLILFDMHSDSRSIIDSDVIRSFFHQNVFGDRSQFLNQLRSNAVIQCFNWIEPLVPHPISRVIWVPSYSLTNEEKKDKIKEIAYLINADSDYSDREISDLSTHFSVLSFEDIINTDFNNSPVLCSLDLDYFYNTHEDSYNKEFSSLFHFISDLNLHAITIAISRPYLKSDKSTDKLLFHSLLHLFSIANTKITLDLFNTITPDRSDLAKLKNSENEDVDYYSLFNASMLIKSILYNNLKKYEPGSKAKHDNKLLELIEDSKKLPKINIFTKKNEICKSLYSNYHFSVTDKYFLKIKVPSNAKIEWYTTNPLYKTYNISSSNMFAPNAPSVVYFEPKALNIYSDKKILLSNEIQQLFSSENRCGTIRLFCIVKHSNYEYISNTITITQNPKNCFNGFLTEQMNLPYIFGSSLLRNHELQGADLLYGAECSTLLQYGMRRSGLDINYGDTGKLISQTDILFSNIIFRSGQAYSNDNRVTVMKNFENRGYIINFGSHVAALFKDNHPVGFLNSSDLMIHSLENTPQIISLGRLIATRKILSINTPKMNKDKN